MDGPTLEAIVAGGAAVAFTTGITQVIKKLMEAAKVSPAWIDALTPLVALAVGVLVVLLAAFGLDTLTRQDIVAGIFAGLFAGLAAIGLWTVTQTPDRVQVANKET